MTDELAQCFKILDLEPTASPDAVKQAYRELVKIWHPDRFMHDDKLLKRAQAKMKEINVAYETIVEHHACEPPRDFHRASPQPPKPPPSSTASLRTEPAAKARGYLWGKFFGILLFCQPFFLGSLLSNGDEFFFVTAFFGVLYWPVGYFVIKRKRWAVVLGTLIFLNPLVWFINIIYFARRWREFSREAGAPISAQPVYILLLIGVIGAAFTV